jgi:hypothetical protein
LAGFSTFLVEPAEDFQDFQEHWQLEDSSALFLKFHRRKGAISAWDLDEP